MRTMASIAALRQACKGLLLHQRRVPRHPASGQQKPAKERTPANSGPFLSAHEMNATEYFYCGTTGYFGRGGMGL